MTASRPTNPQANATSVSSLPATPGRLTLLARQSDYYWTRLRRTWKGSIVTAVVTPLMYVLAMGVVLGGVIDEAGTGPAGAPSYLHFIAAGLLCGQAMTIALNDSTYPIYGALKWDKTWYSLLATPLRPSDVITGALAAILTRAALSCAVFMAVLAGFGVFASLSGALLAFGVQLLITFAFAAVVMAFSVWTSSEQGFSVVFRVILVPLYLFSGAFFPVDNLGPVLARLTMASPLWHGIELTRALMLDTPMSVGAAFTHVAVLVVLGVVGWVLAVRFLAAKATS